MLASLPVMPLQPAPAASEPTPALAAAKKPVSQADAAPSKPAATEAAKPKTSKPAAAPATAAAKPAKKALATEVAEPTSPQLSPEAVCHSSIFFVGLNAPQAEEIVTALVPAEIRALLDNEAWKERLNGATLFVQHVQTQESFGSHYVVQLWCAHTSRGRAGSGHRDLPGNQIEGMEGDQLPGILGTVHFLLLSSLLGHERLLLCHQGVGGQGCYFPRPHRVYHGARVC
jgi:hypothetical protein